MYLILVAGTHTVYNKIQIAVVTMQNTAAYSVGHSRMTTLKYIHKWHSSVHTSVHCLKHPLLNELLIALSPDSKLTCTPFT